MYEIGMWVCHRTTSIEGPGECINLGQIIGFKSVPVTWYSGNPTPLSCVVTRNGGVEYTVPAEWIVGQVDINLVINDLVEHGMLPAGTVAPDFVI